MAITTEKFKFAVDSSLLSELGEKLVTTVHVALAELVKNAYDADATTVTVQILPEASGAPRVIITDDGTGMTPEDVRRYWMKIGTTNKADHPTSADYGRLKTGSKGIGRFACRRLGLHLALTTTAKKSASQSAIYETTSVDFHWNDFAPGKGVDAVPCVGKISSSKAGQTGTRLEIWGGGENEWQARGFKYLQRQLAALASNRGTRRTGYQPDPGFNVVLEAPELSETPIDLRDTIIDATWGTLTAKVERDGRATLALTARGLRGTKKHTSSARFPGIAGASLRVGILPRSKDDARDKEILAQYVLTEVMEDWGGIQVRFNGFRMFPYGDAGDDWLQIDADRARRLTKPEGELFTFAKSLNRINPARAMLNMLSRKNYLGQVDVTSKMKGLRPRIDRQGFVENDEFEQLRGFVRLAVDWANIYREHYIRLRDEADTEKARQAIRPVLNLEGPKEQIVPKAATFLRKEIKRIVQRLPESQRKDTEQNLVGTVRAIESVSAESHKQLQHLRLIASASTLTLLFAHEVRTVIGTLGAASMRLDQLTKKVPGYAPELKTLGDQLRETKGRFDNLVSMTGIVGAFRSSDTLVEVHLKSAIERAVQCFQLVIDNYEITVDDSNVATSLTVGPMIEGELYTVLLNILSNAIKSVIAGGNTERTIQISTQRRADRTIVQISDTGLGLDEDHFEEVFTPFVADPASTLYDKLEERANPEDASLFGTGSGLGLAIARDIARSRRGEIRFTTPEFPWSATVEVEFP